MNTAVEIVKKEDVVLAIIIRSSFQKEGIHFFTPEDFGQQLGFIRHEKNDVVQAHIHQKIKREVSITQETIVMRKGSMKVNVYDNNQEFVESKILKQGDIILLSNGGHEMKFLEPAELIEIKQGPYLGADDKVRFQGKEQHDPSQ